MIIKALLFSVVSFVVTMAVGFFVAAIIKAIGTLLKGKSETATKSTK